MKGVVCDSLADNDRRGLCGVHYSQFNAADKNLPLGDRETCEREFSGKELLFSPKPKGRVVTGVSFAAIASQRLQYNQKTIDEDTAEIIAEGDEQLRTYQPKFQK